VAAGWKQQRATARSAAQGARVTQAELQGKQQRATAAEAEVPHKPGVAAAGRERQHKRGITLAGTLAWPRETWRVRRKAAQAHWKEARPGRRQTAARARLAEKLEVPHKAVPRARLKQGAAAASPVAIRAAAGKAEARGNRQEEAADKPAVLERRRLVHAWSRQTRYVALGSSRAFRQQKHFCPNTQATSYLPGSASALSLGRRALRTGIFGTRTQTHPE